MAEQAPARPPLISAEEALAKFLGEYDQARNIVDRAPVPTETLKGIACQQLGEHVLAFKCRCGHKQGLAGTEERGEGVFWCHHCNRLYRVVQEG